MPPITVGIPNKRPLEETSVCLKKIDFRRSIYWRGVFRRERVLIGENTVPIFKALHSEALATICRRCCGYHRTRKWKPDFIKRFQQMMYVESHDYESWKVPLIQDEEMTNKVYTNKIEIVTCFLSVVSTFSSFFLKPLRSYNQHFSGQQNFYFSVLCQRCIKKHVSWK